MKKLNWLAAMAVASMALLGCENGTTDNNTPDTPKEPDTPVVTTTYDTLVASLQEVSSWQSITSEAVDVTGNGTYVLEVKAEDFANSYYNSAENDTLGWFPFYTERKGAHQGDNAAFNFYFSSKAAADNQWTKDDIDVIKVATKLFYMEYGTEEYKEVTLSEGYSTTVKEVMKEETDSEGNKTQVGTGAYEINVSLINPWADDYVDLASLKDAKIAKLKVEVAISGITK
ncbi:hypothetical protein [uncultured Treponema sp.]|uniref:hypothetical protein n=1 Tax=uncultured Treponema sp. TaxID=162155 RepID=UPI0015AF4EA8|nr:hypothetical protein [uncultured Treponema sp.]